MQVPFVNTGSGSFWVRFWAFLSRLGRGIAAALRYIFFFEWVTDLARWLITTGGNIAESAFLLATVYVTINTVAHQLIAWLVPDNVVVVLNQVSVIAFSVLPELIIFAAIKVTFDHFKMAVGTKRLDSWVWAIAYSLPTLVFLGLTIFTISSFVSVEAVTNNAPQATGVMLVVRCLAGWSYGMLQMLWAKLGHEGYSNLFTQLSDKIVELGAKVLVRDASITTLEADKTTLQAEIVELGAKVAARDHSITASLVEIAQLKDQGINQSNLLKLRDRSIAALQSEIEELKEQNSTLDAELVETRVALAGANRKMKASTQDDTVDEMTTPDDVVVNSKQYQIVKEHMQATILRGEKINMKKVAADSGVSYNTVRRHSQSIINELVKSTERLRVVHSEQESA